MPAITEATIVLKPTSDWRLISIVPVFGAIVLAFTVLFALPASKRQPGPWALFLGGFILLMLALAVLVWRERLYVSASGIMTKGLLWGQGFGWHEATEFYLSPFGSVMLRFAKGAPATKPRVHSIMVSMFIEDWAASPLWSVVRENASHLTIPQNLLERRKWPLWARAPTLLAYLFGSFLAFVLVFAAIERMAPSALPGGAPFLGVGLTAFLFASFSTGARLLIYAPWVAEQRKIEAVRRVAGQLYVAPWVATAIAGIISLAGKVILNRLSTPTTDLEPMFNLMAVLVGFSTPELQFRLLRGPRVSE
jgi:hypothetical protein